MAPSVSSHSSGLLGQILQRAPIITHLSLIPLALWGPTYCPLIFAMVLLFVHSALLSVNLRSLFGAYTAINGVRVHAATDWRLEWSKGREAKVNAGTGRQILALEQVEHVILLPNYAEDLGTLRETLDVLASHFLARSSYRVVLAMEERETTAPSKASTLISEYADQFLDISYTLHPSNIAGEAAGKSSNLAWASRATAIRHRKEDSTRLGRMVFTVIDSDTCFASDYFASVACKFALGTPEERSRMMFVPTICFDRNASSVPVSVRVTDIFWGIAGMSTTCPGSRAKIPTSAYGVSMILAASVGFWDAGPESIGEDMHMALKCIFSTRGNVIAHTIYSPASQLDVVAGQRGGLQGLWNDHKARYSQAVRHMWGCLDTGYAYRRLLSNEFGRDNTVFALTAPDEPTALSLDLHSSASSYLDRRLSMVATGKEEFEMSPMLSPTESSARTSLDGFMSTTTSSSATSLSDSPVLSPADKMYTGGVASEPQYYALPKLAVLPFLDLFSRLYEAHMLMGNIFVILACFTLGGTPVLATPVLADDKWITWLTSPAFATFAINITGRMRNLSLVLTIAMCCCYDAYHRVTSKTRWLTKLDSSKSTPTTVSHLGLEPSERSMRPLPLCLLDYFFIPAGIVFGIVPLLHVQIFQVFTNRLQYTVSLKPQVKARPLVSQA